MIYNQIIKENDLVYDVGANIGKKTAMLLSCGAKVIAIEPQPLCINKLKSKYNNNKKL